MRVFTFLVVVAACQPQQQFPDPDWVADAGDVLSADEESQLVAMLLALNDETTVELACVTVDGTGVLSAEAYADELLWRWEVGLPGVYNGIVMLIDIRERQVRISRGDGMRWTLVDDDVRAIIAAMMVHLGKDRYFSGIQSGIEEVARRVAGVEWGVTYFDLQSLPQEGAEGAVVTFAGMVSSVQGDTVHILGQDSILAKVVLLPGTAPMVMEDHWYVHARVKRQSPLELLLLGVEAGGASADLH